MGCSQSGPGVLPSVGGGFEDASNKVEEARKKVEDALNSITEKLPNSDANPFEAVESVQDQISGFAASLTKYAEDPSSLFDDGGCVVVSAKALIPKKKITNTFNEMHAKLEELLEKMKEIMTSCAENLNSFGSQISKIASDITDALKSLEGFPDVLDDAKKSEDKDESAKKIKEFQKYAKMGGLAETLKSFASSFDSLLKELGADTVDKIVETISELCEFIEELPGKINKLLFPFCFLVPEPIEDILGKIAEISEILKPDEMKESMKSFQESLKKIDADSIRAPVDSLTSFDDALAGMATALEVAAKAQAMAG